MRFLAILLVLKLAVSALSLTDELSNSLMDYDPIESEHEWTTATTASTDSSSSSILLLKTKETSHLASMVRDQLQIELRKMKSSITDSIMEELISYYGQKFSDNDVLKEEIENLTRKVQALSQNFNLLGNNYKSLSTNHRNLVDVVRSNLMRMKKERRLATSRRNTGSQRASGDKKETRGDDTTETTTTRAAASLANSLKLIMSDASIKGDEDLEVTNEQLSSSDYDSNNRIVRHDETQKSSDRNAKIVINGNLFDFKCANEPFGDS